jgi:hypothetical protein
MANAIYPKWKAALLQNLADSDLDGSGTTGVYAALYDVGAGGAYDANDEFYTDLSAGIVGTPVEIGATKSYTSGIFDGADVTWTSVSGATCEAIVIYRQNAGANTTWRLVAYLDTNVTGLPVTPNGGNITVAWNASGIFAL